MVIGPIGENQEIIAIIDIETEIEIIDIAAIIGMIQETGDTIEMTAEGIIVIVGIDIEDCLTLLSGFKNHSIQECRISTNWA